MEKLLMLGTSNTSVELIKLAKARGIYTITTDYLEPERSVAKLVSDEYWMINTADIDTLEVKCREEGVTAVISGVSEFNAECMMKLCERLNLPCWCTPQSWDVLQKKHIFKKMCRETGVPIATDYFLSNPPTEAELDEIQFPVVVKPVDQWLSRGRSYCNTKEEVVKACEYARSVSACDTIIVERKLSGNLCMAHCAIAEGEASQFAFTLFFTQPDLPAGYFYFVITANNLFEAYEKNVMPSVQRLVKAAGCKEGVCWTQNFFDTDDQFYAIEMGYRSSGDMMAIPLEQATGFSTLEWLLDIAMGIEHHVEDLPRKNLDKYACSFILSSHCSGTIQKIEGIEEVSAMPEVKLWVEVKEGQQIETHNLLARVTYVADSVDSAIEIVNKIGATLKIINEDNVNMAMHFNDFEQVRTMLAR